MESFISGMLTLFNGMLSLLGAIASPIVLTGVVMALALLWLAIIEIEELNRRGSKPEVGRH